MGKSILKLVPQPRIRRQEVIDLLNQYLKMAKKGEIESIAIVSLLTNGGSTDASSDSDRFQALIGAVNILHHKMVRNATEMTNAFDS